MARASAGFAAELQGGLLAAVASIPQTLPMGVVVFAPLGTGAIGHGVVAALVSSVIGGTLVGLFGPMKAQIAGPRSGSALVLAQVSAFLAAAPGIAGPDGAALARALPLLAFVVVLAGLLQFVAGQAGLARLIKFLPLPVLSGFTLALGLGMMISTLPAFLGLPLGATFAGGIRVGAPTAAIACWVTVALFFLATRYGRSWPLPPIVVAFLGGLAAAVTGEKLMPAPVALTAAAPVEPLVSSWLGLDWAGAAQLLTDPGFAFGLAGFVAVLALISSIESLLSVVACDAKTGEDTDANSELRTEGLSNMIAGACGGITISASIGRTAVNLAAGARGPLSALIAASVSALLLIADHPADVVPSAVLQGILFVIGFGLYDGRLGLLIRGVSDPARRRKGQAGEIVVLVGTAVMTLAAGATIGLALGLVGAVAFFLVSMSRPVIFAETTGRRRRSRHTRPPAQAAYLFERGDETLVAELEGPIFFGTADQVRRWMQRHAATPPRSLVLSLSRIFDIDATGAAVLVQAARRFTAETGAAVAIAGLTAAEPRMRVLAEARFDRVGRRFDDLDHALEWAEDRILDEAPEAIRAAARRSLPLIAGATAEQVALLERHLEHRRLSAGEEIFRQGEAGDALYFLEDGAVRIEWQAGGGRPMRLATLTSGVVFGEMSLIDGAPRSAGARAETAVTVLRLSKDALEAIAAEAPDLALLLMRGLAAEMAQRLRLANAALSEVNS